MIFVLYTAVDNSSRCIAGTDLAAIDAFISDGGFTFTSPMEISEETVRQLGFELLDKAVESISKGHSSTFLLGLPTNVPGNRHRAELKQQS